MAYRINPKYRIILEILLILIIAALAYLPNMSKASIYRDDWYYALDRTIGGPTAFPEMFKIDRPARGPLFEAYYLLFGVMPFAYHLSSFFWRVLGGIAALYLFNLLWPRQRNAALLMGLLFMLFPGYSRWLEGFENQPRIISSVLEVVSIALTLQAISSTKKTIKILAWTGSILAGWAYIAFVDFSIGMEAFRLLCMFLLVSHQNLEKPFLKKGLLTLKAWAIAALIPLIFLIWRLFIFHNERPTTDIGLQLSALVDSPVHTALTWAIRLFQSSLNVAFLAWSMPTAQTIFNYTVSETVIGIFIAFAAVFFVLMAFFLLNRMEEPAPGDKAENQANSWQFEAACIGLLGVVFGVIPVVMANRYATLGNYSHYALPASLASVAMVAGIVHAISSSRIRMAVISILILLAVLTQYAVSIRITNEETIVSNFWQQMAWRAPGIARGTTLVVNYPSVDYGQDIDTVDGPANYLYYPELTNQIPALYPIAALEQGESIIKNIYSDPSNSYTFRYRTHKSEINYRNLLVISQPTQTSCVHILNSSGSEVSIFDPYSISFASQYSRVEQVVVSGSQAPKPDSRIFGNEPAHGWCFYYQKAELSFQTGDWKQIVNLGNEAMQKNLQPEDAIEWLPFIQAYANAGDIKNIEKIAKAIKKEPVYKTQTCSVLQKLAAGSHPIAPSIKPEVLQLFCAN